MYLFEDGNMLLRGPAWQAAQPGHGGIHPVVTCRRKESRGSFTAGLATGLVI